MTELEQLRRLVEQPDSFLGTAAGNANLPAILSAWERDREALNRILKFATAMIRLHRRNDDVGNVARDIIGIVNDTLPKGTQ